jgi:hypothetical protein
MTKQPSYRPMAVLFWLCISLQPSWSAVAPLMSPIQINGGTTLNFDQFTHNTIINNSYQSQGITFTRDDGQAVLAYDYSAIGRTTPSPPNVLSTAVAIGINTTFSTHLNVFSTSPLYAVGAYWGNDRGDPDFTSISMSVFGVSGESLGSVSVLGNGIRSADQFIGLISDVPFARVRFDNLNSVGGQSVGFAVSVDNFTFTSVPEPSTVWLLGLGSVTALYVFRNRTNGRSL